VKSKRIVQPAERNHALSRERSDQRAALDGPKPQRRGGGVEEAIGEAVFSVVRAIFASPASIATFLIGALLVLPVQNLILEPAFGPLGWSREQFALAGTGAAAAAVVIFAAAIVGASGGKRSPKRDARGERLAELIGAAFPDGRVEIIDVQWSKAGPARIDLAVPPTTPRQAVSALFEALTRAYRLPSPQVGEPRMFWAVQHDSHSDTITAALEAGIPDFEPWSVDDLKREVDACVEDDPDPWHIFPVGRFSRGETARLKLEAAPHSLVTGTTGSGKSTVLELLVAVALLRDWELRLVDPKRQQFARFSRNPRREIPVSFGYADGWQAIVAAKAEMERRKQLCFDLGAEKWQQAGGQIRPLMVVIDEVFALLEEKPADEEQAALKADAEAALWSIAREGRAPGVHLVLAAQRPDAKVIQGEARNNLMTRMLMGSQPSPASIQMVLPDVPIPRRPLDMIGDGGLGGTATREERSPGIGLCWQDGWRYADVLRAAYIDGEVRDAVVDELTTPVQSRPATPSFAKKTAPEGSTLKVVTDDDQDDSWL
jgi:energy-coupling factor transporter ATP-binding protein EcfA2